MQVDIKYRYTEYANQTDLQILLIRLICVVDRFGCSTLTLFVSGRVPNKVETNTHKIRIIGGESINERKESVIV